MSRDVDPVEFIVASALAVVIGVTLLVFGTFVTTWLVMLGWGSAYNNGIADQAPGYWDLFFPVLCFGAAITGVTYNNKS